MLSGVTEAMRGPNWRRQVAQVVQVLYVIASALAIWKGLSLVTNTESPVVVVLSGSMEPAFHRGDLLFLTMSQKPIEIGEITVYQVPGTAIPIVHRVIETRETCVSSLQSPILSIDRFHVPSTNLVVRKNRGQLLLTKGDNNYDDDIMLYNGPRWIRDDQIVGRVQGYV